MSKKITVNYEGRKYTLEFSRNTVKLMERAGFKIGEVFDAPHTLVPKLFYGAFQMHHKRIDGNLVEKIWETLKGRDTLTGKLVDMYQETLVYLFGFDDTETGGEDEQNLGWTEE